MAIIKHAYIRYKVLDACFSNPGKKYFFQDLIDECNKVLLDLDSSSNGICTRQIREDIAFMKTKEGWDIELGEFREGRKMYYRYINTDFSINNMPLNELEIEHLKEETVYIYCRSGNRSGQACLMLEPFGFKNVINVSGGMLAWQEQFPG